MGAQRLVTPRKTAQLVYVEPLTRLARPGRSALTQDALGLLRNGRRVINELRLERSAGKGCMKSGAASLPSAENAFLDLTSVGAARVASARSSRSTVMRWPLSPGPS